MNRSVFQVWLLGLALVACATTDTKLIPPPKDGGPSADAGGIKHGRDGGADARVADAADLDSATPNKHPVTSPADSGADDSGAGDANTSDASATTFGTRVRSARIFGSGHSLLDDPLLDDIIAVAKSLGDSAKYNEQIVIGSPIRVRTRGDNAASTGWSGYSQGKNLNGATGLNVINELRSPTTLGAGEHYDTLLIAEREDLIDVVIWEDSVRYLRHFHERLIEGDAQGTTYYFTTWGQIDRLHPDAFVTYERAALTAWECEAERINTSLAAENRSDRLIIVPTSGAMAELVDRAISSPGIAGISDASPSVTTDHLFKDNQHSLPLGVYYTSLVNYAAIFHHSPVGAWAPSGVTHALATALQNIAWSYVSNYYEHRTPPTQAQCLDLMANSFCAAYYARFNETTTQECLDYFAMTTSANAYYYDASSDGAYWFAAPP